MMIEIGHADGSKENCVVKKKNSFGELLLDRSEFSRFEFERKEDAYFILSPHWETRKYIWVPGRLRNGMGGKSQNVYIKRKN